MRKPSYPSMRKISKVTKETSNRQISRAGTSRSNAHGDEAPTSSVAKWRVVHVK